MIAGFAAAVLVERLIRLITLGSWQGRSTGELAMEYVARFLINRLAVSTFALLSDVLRPESFVCSFGGRPIGGVSDIVHRSASARRTNKVRR